MSYYHDRSYRVRKQKFIRRRTPLQEFNYGQSYVSDDDQLIVMNENDTSPNSNSNRRNIKCDSQSPTSGNHKSKSSSNNNSSRNSSDPIANRQNKQARDDHNEQERRRRRELAIIYELIRCCFDDDDLQIIFPGKLSRSKDKLSYPQILQIANEILAQESHDILLLESTLDDVKRIEGQLLQLGIQPPPRPWQFSIYDNYSFILKETEENLKADKCIKLEEGNYGMSPAERALHINDKLLQIQKKSLYRKQPGQQQSERKFTHKQQQPSNNINLNTNLNNRTIPQHGDITSPLLTSNTTLTLQTHGKTKNPSPFKLLCQGQQVVKMPNSFKREVNDTISYPRVLTKVNHEKVSMRTPHKNVDNVFFGDEMNREEYLPPYDEENPQQVVEDQNCDIKPICRPTSIGLWSSSPSSSSQPTPFTLENIIMDDFDDFESDDNPCYEASSLINLDVNICDSIFLQSKSFFKSDTNNNHDNSLDVTIHANDSTCATDMSDQTAHEHLSSIRLFHSNPDSEEDDPINDDDDDDDEEDQVDDIDFNMELLPSVKDELKNLFDEVDNLPEFDNVLDMDMKLDFHQLYPDLDVDFFSVDV